jgi:Antibiotic biosynthesis monooxygenase
MKTMRIANYKITKGTFSDVADVAKEGMLKTFRNEPGFLRYGLADTGDQTCISISLWETRAQAESATLVSSAWVLEHLSDRVELVSTKIGDLAFFEGVPATV